MSLRTWWRQGPHNPSSCATFTVNLPEAGLLQVEKKSLAFMQNRAASSGSILSTVAGQASQSVVFSRQEYWSGLPHPSTALYFLLPQPPTPMSTYDQNPCDPGSFTTSTPGPHWVRPKASRAASGANPSGRPTSRCEDKTTMKPRIRVAKEEDPKPSHQLYKQPIKSTRSTRQILSLWNIRKDIESCHKRKHTSSDSCGHLRQEYTGDQSLNCPHSRSRDQRSVGGHPREARWTVTPREGKDSRLKKTMYYSYIFTCSVVSLGFFFLFSSPSVLAVTFISTMNLIELLSFFNHIFDCYYKPLSLHWCFAVPQSFPFVFLYFKL